jgi:hypothetical protein
MALEEAALHPDPVQGGLNLANAKSRVPCNLHKWKLLLIIVDRVVVNLHLEYGSLERNSAISKS